MKNYYYFIGRFSKHITGNYGIQYEEMEEAEEGRNPQLNFTLNFPGTSFDSGEYPVLTE